MQDVTLVFLQKPPALCRCQNLGTATNPSGTNPRGTIPRGTNPRGTNPRGIQTPEETSVQEEQQEQQK